MKISALSGLYFSQFIIVFAVVVAAVAAIMETMLRLDFTENVSTVDLVKYYSNLKTLTNDEICRG